MADSDGRRSAYGLAIARMCRVAGLTGVDASVGAGFCRCYAANASRVASPTLKSLDRIAQVCGYEVALVNRERGDAFSVSRMLRRQEAHPLAG